MSRPMNNLLFLLSVLLGMMVGFAAFGEHVTSKMVSTDTTTTDVPSHLKGATIIVRLADGRESSVPAEKFKVVPRKQQFIVTRTEKQKLISCVNNTPNKNRASLVGGYGSRNGLTVSSNGSVVEVENKVGLVGGLQYQRLITDKLSIGVQGQTNKTGSVLIGLDF